MIISRLFLKKRRLRISRLFFKQFLFICRIFLKCASLSRRYRLMKNWIENDGYFFTDRRRRTLWDKLPFFVWTYAYLMGGGAEGGYIYMIDTYWCSKYEHWMWHTIKQVTNLPVDRGSSIDTGSNNPLNFTVDLSMIHIICMILGSDSSVWSQEANPFLFNFFCQVCMCMWEL